LVSAHSYRDIGLELFMETHLRATECHLSYVVIAIARLNSQSWDPWLRNL